MAEILHLGVNLCFARYVWGPEAAIDLARDRLGLCNVEVSAENDFGPALFILDRAAFVARHRAAGQHALQRGVRIPSVFTFYRDGGAVSHPDAAVRRAAQTVLESLLLEAASLGASFAGAALMTAEREEYERDPAGCRERALECWTAWMTAARAAGLEGLLLEMSAQRREDCATLDQARETLDWLADYHRRNPDTTVPVELCYDVGHGISREEAADDSERDFRAWFRAFPDTIRQVHLKNTDPDFLSTWPFTPEYAERGIISPTAVVEAARNFLRGEVYLTLEIAGKRGREIGEEAILRDLEASVKVWKDALRSGGYRERADGAWQR